MSAADHKRITKLFLQAVELPPGERVDFLKRLGSSDPQAREDVESLLRHDDNGRKGLKTAAMVSEANRVLVSVPETIGPYRVVEKIGEGGMGVVYRAEQTEPIRRQVAVKLIKLGLETEAVLRRFESERLTLARMDHPGIARVLDAGVAVGGRPFFAMEFVDGVPITEFCDLRRFDVESRLRLFLQVCDAVEHAHRNAVIHRDLKPSNILVAASGELVLPKIIDFGVAKALTADPVEGTLTQAGEVVGTLGYMSPEQAAEIPNAIDTRTDVYSLGALLYELLAGVPPFDPARIRDAGPRDARRWIVEDEPIRPSQRVSRGGPVARLIADARRTQPSKLAGRLRGDLDCIVRRALEKEPARRYGSAAALAADLRRHLDNDPIEARPPTPLYRLVKLARRRRTAAAITAMLTLSIVTFAATMAVQARRIAIQRDLAETTAEQLVRAFDAPFYLQGRHSALPADEVLFLNADAILAELDQRPLLQARLRRGLGQSLAAMGQMERAEAQLTAAHAGFLELVGPTDPLTLAPLHDLGMLGFTRWDPDAATRVRESVEAHRRNLGHDHPDTLRAMADLGYICKRTRRYEEARRWLEPAKEGLERLLGRDNEETRVVTSLLAAVYLEMRMLDESQALLEDLIPRNEGGLEECIAIYNLSCVLALRGERQPALDLLQHAHECGFLLSPLGDPAWRGLIDDPEFIARSKEYHLARLDYSVVHVAEWLLSEGHGEQVDRLLDRIPRTHWWGRHVAHLFAKRGRYDEALRMLQETQSGQIDFWSAAQLQLYRGDVDGALSTLDAELQASSRARWPTSGSYYARARQAALRGDRDTALQELREAARFGYTRIDLLSKDLALKELRGTEEYEEVLAEIRRRTWVP